MIINLFILIRGVRMKIDGNQIYAHLKAKLDEISENAPLLTGENNIVELDPDNINQSGINKGD